jgi:5-methylcytosine-specific restriction endonuclease McrA
MRRVQREKERETRKVLVAHYGGKCQRCGYDKYEACLEFHHINNSDKKGKHFLLEILNHTANFQLLCNRCHRELHHDSLTRLEASLAELNLRHQEVSLENHTTFQGNGLFQLRPL